MEIFAECERLSLPVVFHAGRAGIEPEAGMNYNLMRHYAEPLTSFPRLPFVLGHAGARDVAEAAPLAIQHENVWLGTHGQSVTSIHELLDSVGPDKLLFGSDWPWYHLGASLAKLLIVTEGKPEARRLILEENAARVLSREPARANV
jgi:predicted TIM-barrel fold metal-dependent hydrolase